MVVTRPDSSAGSTTRCSRRSRAGSRRRTLDPGPGRADPDGGPRTMRWGIQPITYGLTWDESLAAARAVEALGFDYLWGHDHLWSTGGDKLQPFFEGWSTITAWAALTERVRLGLLVGANPFRHPSVVAKIAATVDHISAGRLILGLGAGNREDETLAHGLDASGSVGERLDRLDEALTIIRGILAGEAVTRRSAH